MKKTFIIFHESNLNFEMGKYNFSNEIINNFLNENKNPENENKKFIPNLIIQKYFNLIKLNEIEKSNKILNENENNLIIQNFINLKNSKFIILKVFYYFINLLLIFKKNRNGKN